MSHTDDWLLCRAKSQREFSVKFDIEEMGHEVYCPVMRKITRPKGKSKPVVSSLPAYPGYLFLHYDDEVDVRVFRRVKHFLGFVRFGDYIASIKERDIKSIQEMEKDNLWDDSGIAVNDIVIVKSGPFENYSGIVTAIDNYRIFVTLNVNLQVLELPPFLLDRVQA